MRGPERSTSTSYGSVDAPSAPRTDAVVEVDALDLRLPCRGYEIRYKVSDSDRFSLTAEFLLRLLHATGSMPEAAIADFFAFSADETRYVVEAAERQGHVSRSSRLVSLTEPGLALFDRGDGTPALYDIQSKRGRFDFDLISFAPADYEDLSDLDFELPELAVTDVTLVARSRNEVARSFKRHFPDLRNRRSGSKTDAETLYTIDDVEPLRRFSAIVPVSVSVRAEDGAGAEPNLLGWRSGIELEQRSGVTGACARFVADIRVPNGYGQEGAAMMAACAPDRLNGFMRRDGTLDAGAFFEAVAPRASAVDLEAGTHLTIGSTWTDANRERLAASIRQADYRYARVQSPTGKPGDPSGARPPLIVWMKPNRPWWGATRRLPRLVGTMVETLSMTDSDGEAVPPLTVLMESGARGEKEMHKTFDAAIRLEGRVPQGLEMLLIASRVAAVSVHVPLSSTGGYPLPLGFISHDPAVVERVHRMLAGIMTRSTQFIAHQALAGDLWAEVDPSLSYVPPPDPGRGG